MKVGNNHKYHILYKTTNIINNNFYIGIHSSNKKIDGYLGSGTTLKKAIKKYGKSNFIRENLYYCTSREDLRELEELVVDEYIIGKSNCYNLTKGGEIPPIMIGENNPMFGKPKSKETKSKISKALSGEKHPLWGKEGYNKGRVLSEEWKRNISEAGKGRKHSPETIKKMKKSRESFKHTEESRKKLSESHKGKILTEKHRHNISKALSISMKGRVFSEEHKKNLSISMKNRGYKKSNNPNSKVVQHSKTGLFFPSLIEGCEFFDIKYSTERQRMSNKKSNNFIYI